MAWETLPEACLGRELFRNGMVRLRVSRKDKRTEVILLIDF